MNYYRSDQRFAGQPEVLTFFSGDAFNPSIESTVTKGRHMVPFLNTIGTDVACVGVSTPVSHVQESDPTNIVRITILTLESPSSDT